MAGISAGLELTKNKLLELNNNSRSSPDLSKINKLRKTSEVSVSSISSVSDCSVDDNFTSKFSRQSSLQDLLGRNKTDSKISAFHRGRSNSDGAAVTLIDNAEVFPSLPVPVLEKMGLYGDGPRERLSEETLEQKFTSLSLAFTIDAATIKDRCDRQRRTRDQTETNFNLEVEKLRKKLALLQPLCTDFDRAELLSTIFAQVDTVTKAASLVSIAGERFGAVQHEERLTESVQLMVSHVQALKQQRDSTRRQLQYTKRVLQDPVEPVPKNGVNNQKIGNINKIVINKRRASIDPSNLSQQEQQFSFNRRISDLSFRASLAKTSRPSRLELGMELNKIKEISHDDSHRDLGKGTPEVFSPNTAKEHVFNFERKVIETHKTNMLRQESFYENGLKYNFNIIRAKLQSYLEQVQRKLANCFHKSSEKSYLHAFLNSCAVLCFSVSILTLVSIFLEQDYIKRISYWTLPWYNKKT